MLTIESKFNFYCVLGNFEYIRTCESINMLKTQNESLVPSSSY